MNLNNQGRSSWQTRGKQSLQGSYRMIVVLILTLFILVGCGGLEATTTSEATVAPEATATPKATGIPELTQVEFAHFMPCTIFHYYGLNPDIGPITTALTGEIAEVIGAWSAENGSKCRSARARYLSNITGPVTTEILQTASLLGCIDGLALADMSDMSASGRIVLQQDLADVTNSDTVAPSLVGYITACTTEGVKDFIFALAGEAE